jgi:hypothetical protein
MPSYGCIAGDGDKTIAANGSKVIAAPIFDNRRRTMALSRSYFKQSERRKYPHCRE